MATPLAESPPQNDVELPPAVHWPTVYTMAGVGGGLAVALVAAVLIAAAQSPSSPQVASAAAPVAAVVTPPSPHPAADVKAASPVEAKPADAGPPVWKPLVPQPPPARIPPLPDSHSIPALEPMPSNEAVPDQPPSSDAGGPSPSGSDLFVDLQSYTHEIDLNTVAGTSARLLMKPGKGTRSASPVVDLIGRRPDLTGLPVRGEAECKASKQAAEALGEVSRDVRRVQSGATLAAQDNLGRAGALDEDRREHYLLKELSEADLSPDDEGAPVLAQMLGAERTAVRVQLTKMLAAVKGPHASTALARLALFDLSPEVREASVRALKDRPRAEFRQTLLDGFRYPWPPVAFHAAAALTAADDRDAVPALTRMLALPDPAGPLLLGNGRWVKPELVKVNHLRNCLLCHAPSPSDSDPVRGFIPKPGEEIPVAYYDVPKGDFVRADVTYLRQDFSVLERVSDPGKWPYQQRFDYLVRLRPLTGEEIVKWEAGPPPTTYPQREAVRLAVQLLKEKDAPPEPPVDPDP